MTKTLRKTLIATLGAVVAVVIVCCSLVALVGVEKGTAPQQVANVGTAISTTGQLEAWIKNPTTDAYLTKDIECTLASASNKTITANLDGNGKTITFNSSNAFANTIIDPIVPLDSTFRGIGLLGGNLTGSVKNVNVVISGQEETIHLGTDSLWNRNVAVGALIGQIGESGKTNGLMENVSLKLNAKFNVTKKTPTAPSIGESSRGTGFIGGMVGRVLGTMRNCSLELNNEIFVNLDGRSAYLGYANGDDYARVAGVVGINEGQMYNTTFIVGSNAKVHSQGQKDSSVGGVVCNAYSSNFKIDGLLIKNLSNLKSKLYARNNDGGNSENIICTKLESGASANNITNIYTNQTGLESIACSGQDNHGGHTYPLVAGATNKKYTTCTDSDLSFEGENANNIYLNNATEGKLIWSVQKDSATPKEVYDSYDIKNKRVGIPKENASTSNSTLKVTLGTIEKGAVISYDTAEYVYGDINTKEQNMPKPIVRANNNVIDINLNPTHDITPVYNANGFVNVGKYTINSISERLVIKSTKTIYIDNTINQEKKSFEVKPKAISIALDENSNIYKATATITGLCGADKVAFSDFQGVTFDKTTQIPQKYLEFGKNLVISAEKLEEKNYYLDKTQTITIKALKVTYDSVIGIEPNQSSITDGKVEIDGENRTLTFKDNSVTSFKFNAVSSVYGFKYTGFNGAETIGSPVSTNGKIVGELAINGSVSHISVVGNVETKTVSVEANGSGTVTSTYNGVTDAKAKAVTLGDKIVLKATIKAGNVFLGWSKNGEYVSNSVEYIVYVGEDVKYVANFASTTSNKTHVVIKNLFDEGIADFYTEFTTEDKILDFANKNYENSVNDEPYNTFVGFAVVSSGTDGYVLKPTYAESTEPIIVKINDNEKIFKLNEKFELEKGDYWVETYLEGERAIKKLSLTEKTSFYALHSMTITEIKSGMSVPEETTSNLLIGKHDNQKGYLNFTIFNDKPIIGDIKLTIYDNGMPKYTKIIKYNRVNSNIIQAIVVLPSAVYTNLSNPTVTATINGNEIVTGSIKLV